MAPRMVGLGQPVLDAVGLAEHVKPRQPGIERVKVPGTALQTSYRYRGK